MRRLPWKKWRDAHCSTRPPTQPMDGEVLTSEMEKKMNRVSCPMYWPMRAATESWPVRPVPQFSELVE